MTTDTWFARSVVVTYLPNNHNPLVKKKKNDFLGTVGAPFWGMKPPDVKKEW